MSNIDTTTVIIVLVVIGVFAAIVHFFMQPKSERSIDGKLLFKARTKEQIHNELKWDTIGIALFLVFIVLLEKCTS